MALSRKQLVASAVNERKRWVDEGTGPASRAGLRGVVPAVGPGPQLVAFEAGHQMKWGADTLKKLAEVQVHVVPPNEGKGLTESRGKTDRVDAKKLAELARAGILPRAVHVVEGRVRELRELVSARQQVQSKRVALLTPLRGSVRQDGHRLPATGFASLPWRARLPLSAPLQLQRISETCRASREALTAAERPLTDRLRAIRDPRCTLLESIPTIGTLASRTLVGALDEARRFDEQKAVGNAGALPPTLYQRGGGPPARAAPPGGPAGGLAGAAAVCAHAGAAEESGGRSYCSSAMDGSRAAGARRSRWWRWPASC